MSGFEHYAANAREIETEILRKGIALGIDWDDPAAVRALAHEAIDHLEHEVDTAASTPADYQLLAKVDLFGLAGLMLKTMEKSAEQGFESHGGPVWRVFAQALWAEKESRRPA